MFLIKRHSDEWINQRCNCRRIRRMSLIWKWQDSDKELILSVNGMTESKVKPRYYEQKNWLGWYYWFIAEIRDSFTAVSGENLSRFCMCLVPIRRNSGISIFQPLCRVRFQSRRSWYTNLIIIKLIIQLCNGRASRNGIILRHLQNAG